MNLPIQTRCRVDPTHGVKVLAAMLLCAAAGLPAWAAGVVSGSFAGIAHGAAFDAGLPPIPTFEGAVVTGRFRLDTDRVGLPVDLSDSFAAYRLPAGALTLSFTVLGQTHEYGNGVTDSAATLSSDASGQGLMFGADFFGSLAHSGSLSLGGAPNVYADGLDLRSFHAGPVDLGFVEAHFRLAPNIGARVEVMQLSFDTPAVPEPARAGLLALGLAALAAALRRPAPWPAAAVTATS